MYYNQYDKKDDEESEKQEPEQDLTIVKLSEQIDYILGKENNKELTILKERLTVYKQELEDKLKLGKPIEHEVFKRFLHSNLEKSLLYIIYIPNKEIRDDKLRILFRWYFEKLEHFNSLDKIKFRTDKNQDEIYRKEDLPSDEILIQDDQYEQQQFKKHRTEIQGLEPPKERLKDFKYKKINPPKKFKKDDKVMADLRFNLERFHGRVGSANSSISLKTTFYATKTGQKWFSNSGVGVDENLKPINPKREVKGGYSYNRPEYDFQKMVIEKEIITAKNKELAEKRNQEEIKIHLDEFGKAKAKYKEEIERKFNHVNIIAAVEKTFKVEKGIDELVEKENNQEENQTQTQNLASKSNVQNTVSSKIEAAKVNETTTLSNFQEDNNFESPTQYTNINNKLMYTRIANLNLLQDSKPKNYVVNLTEDKKNLMQNLLLQKEQNMPVRPDTFAMRTVDDKVLKARVQGGVICNVKDIDNPKLGYTHHFTPLSAFDYVNYQNYDRELPKPTPKLERPRTASEFAFKNFNKYADDFLGLRKKMDTYKKTEIEMMNEKVFNGTDCNRKITSYENALFVPKLEVERNTFLAPRPQTSLLKRPPDIPGKKKRRPKSKKRRF